ncbi:MAG: DUF4199 domain-containing protein [Flavobacteriales bacterium]|jgi:hypothetical protein
MKKGRLIGLYLALIWIGVKFFAWYMEFFVFDSIHPYVLFNMALLTCAIAIGLFYIKQETLEASNLLLDIKNAMSVGMIYTVLVAGFIYVFYAFIHPNYAKHQLEESRTYLQSPKHMANIRLKNEDFRNKSDAEIREMEMSKAETIYSTKFTLVLSLLAMTLWAMLNSVVISIIYRTVLFKPRQ